MNNEDRLKIWEFLEKNHLGTLATVSAELSPHVSLVYYLTEESSHIYIVTTKGSKKYQNFLKNNKIAFLVQQEPTKVLVLEGELQEIIDPTKIETITKRYLEIANKSNPESENWPPILKLSTEEGFIFWEIVISRFKFSDFSDISSLIIEETSEAN